MRKTICLCVGRSLVKERIVCTACARAGECGCTCVWSCLIGAHAQSNYLLSHIQITKTVCIPCQALISGIGSSVTFLLCFQTGSRDEWVVVLSPVNVLIMPPKVVCLT